MQVEVCIADRAQNHMWEKDMTITNKLLQVPCVHTGFNGTIYGSGNGSRLMA